MRRDVFQAIADPNRRKIIHLVTKQRMNLNAVAENFTISRPAVSKHMKILTECGLVTIRQEGRDRFCEVNLRQLKEVDKWIEPYRIFWTAKLDALGDFLNKDNRPVKKNTSTKKKYKQ